MVNPRGGVNDTPIFVGLSHIGQVFSLGWALKLGPCAVFDFDAARRARFAAGELTDEEPELAGRWPEARGRITTHDDPRQITRHRVVFLTIDTPLNQQGEPNVEAIRAFIAQCVPHVGRDATMILLSQVYPGFCADVRRELLAGRDDIRLVYMVDTLKMGQALPRFLEPEQLIFGADRPEDVPEAFRSFGCPVHIYSREEAEMVKVAINIYLLFSVTFANAMDNYCRQRGFRFAPIANALRHDARIGPKAYIAPSLGVSGGHLERDLTTVIRNCADPATRRLFEEMQAVNAERMQALYDAVGRGRLRSLLWIGVSYKRESFSLVNSPFMKFVDRFGQDLSLTAYDSYYPLPSIQGVAPARDLSAELDAVDGVVFHYASEPDTAAVEQAFARRSGLAGFDISLPPALRAAQSGAGNVRRVF